MIPWSRRPRAPRPEPRRPCPPVYRRRKPPRPGLMSTAAFSGPCASATRSSGTSPARSRLSRAGISCLAVMTTARAPAALDRGQRLTGAGQRAGQRPGEPQVVLPVDAHRVGDLLGGEPEAELVFQLDAQPAVHGGRVDRHTGRVAERGEGGQDHAPRVDQGHVQVEPDRCPLVTVSAGCHAAGSSRSRAASSPAKSSTPFSTKSTAIGRFHDPVAECSSPSSSGPALASR